MLLILLKKESIYLLISSSRSLVYLYYLFKLALTDENYPYELGKVIVSVEKDSMIL